MHRLLIVEDEPALLRGLETVFRNAHYEVLTAADGNTALAVARREPLDVILLDLILPDIGGTDVCRTLRQEGNSTPILMLTSKTEEMDKVLGLELGADDYVTKPFSIRELEARVRALERRRGEAIPVLAEFAFGDVYVNVGAQQVTRGGRPVTLSVKEFHVLKYLIEREGRVITREMFLDDVWGYEAFPTTRTVDNVILSLRRKLESAPSVPRHILTVYGAGYRFVRTPDDPASPTGDEAGEGS